MSKNAVIYGLDKKSFREKFLGIIIMTSAEFSLMGPDIDKCILELVGQCMHERQLFYREKKM